MDIDAVLGSLLTRAGSVHEVLADGTLSDAGAVQIRRVEPRLRMAAMLKTAVGAVAVLFVAGRPRGEMRGHLDRSATAVRKTDRVVPLGRIVRKHRVSFMESLPSLGREGGGGAEGRDRVLPVYWPRRDGVAYVHRRDGFEDELYYISIPRNGQCSVKGSKDASGISMQ